MKIIFAGTPEFAAEALSALISAGHDIALVLTQPDRPSGRGMKLTPSPVRVLAESKGIPVATPETLSLKRAPQEAAEMHRRLKEIGADLLVVAAYGLILPQAVLDCARGIGRHGDIRAVNIHASLLPRWRGAAPIARAIEAGDPETGVTLMKMEIGLDTGPMIETERTAITAKDTTATLTERLAAIGSRLLVSALEHPDTLDWIPQPEEGVLYAEKLLKTESRIDWAHDAAALARRLRAFTPFPGMQFSLGEQSVKVWEAEAIEVQQTPEGTVLEASDTLTVACGKGALRMTVLQKAGKPRQPAASVLQSFHLMPGDTIA